MSGFPTGVTIVTTRADGRVSGTAVNAFSAVSMSPSILLVCLKSDSRTLAAIRQAGVFAVNILADHQADLVSRFASKDEEDRFRDVSHASGVTGSPLLDRAVAAFDCEVHAIVDGGDHDVLLGRVLDVRMDAERSPLLYHRGQLSPLRQAEPVAG
jgi:3-hydroxy-9,10-secoandrosta-1,3,5(10)-triene-9,17-dione monooxygenase reductase component